VHKKVLIWYNFGPEILSLSFSGKGFVSVVCQSMGTNLTQHYLFIYLFIFVNPFMLLFKMDLTAQNHLKTLIFWSLLLPLVFGERPNL